MLLRRGVTALIAVHPGDEAAATAHLKAAADYPSMEARRPAAPRLPRR
jgi:hypothetical protein